MKKKLLNSQILYILLLLSSCSSYKNVPYFQDIDRSSIQKKDINNFSPLTIQSGDILEINVSSINPEYSKFFNGSATAGESNNLIQTYLVDTKGNIEMPVIGLVNVLNLTTPQIHDLLQSKMEPYLKDFILKIKISNFQFTVVGDVGHPGVFQSPNEEINIIEALAMAGDLDITAKRENVLLIREIDGKREFVTLDLTNSKLFQSPYYYIKSNDMIYVDPDRTKYTSVSNSRANIELGISVISLFAIFYSIFHR